MLKINIKEVFENGIDEFFFLNVEDSFHIKGNLEYGFLPI
jgi:hypothetical protein